MKFNFRYVLIIGIISSCLLLFQPKSNAVNPHIIIPLGQVMPVEVREGILTFVIGTSDVANVVIPPGQNTLALINPVGIGVTNLLIWTEKSPNPITYVIEVVGNCVRNKEGQIMLGPNGKPLCYGRYNDQIITRIKVLEVLRGGDGTFGIDWSDFVTFKEAPVDAPFKFGFPTRITLLEAKINTLLTDRKAKLIAKPTLVSLHGQPASFLSGGEVPLAVSDRDRINIQWKPFGISLNLIAEILEEDQVKIKLQPSVSSLDRVNSITIQGGNGGSTIIPAFTTRNADTTVVLRSGESVVIAGLLSETKEEMVNKFPLLGDIPILGYLFSTTEFKNVKSELVFIVTPTIVKGKIDIPEKNYASDKSGEPSTPIE